VLEELRFELWIGDPLEIRATRVRKQKTDRHNAQLLLKLLLEDRFPRIWVASWENRDLRQLLWHRHRLVRMRTRIMNQLQAVVLNEGVRRKKRLWGQAGRAQLESFVLAPWFALRSVVRSSGHVSIMKSFSVPALQDLLQVTIPTKPRTARN
jgi:transposase